MRFINREEEMGTTHCNGVGPRQCLREACAGSDPCRIAGQLRLLLRTGTNCSARRRDDESRLRSCIIRESIRHHHRRSAHVPRQPSLFDPVYITTAASSRSRLWTMLFPGGGKKQIQSPVLRQLRPSSRKNQQPHTLPVTYRSQQIDTVRRSPSLLPKPKSFLTVPLPSTGGNILRKSLPGFSRVIFK